MNPQPDYSIVSEDGLDEEWYCGHPPHLRRIELPGSCSCGGDVGYGIAFGLGLRLICPVQFRWFTTSRRIGVNYDVCMQ